MEEPEKSSPLSIVSEPVDTAREESIECSVGPSDSPADNAPTAMIPPTVYYSKVGLELAKLVFRGQNMSPP